MEHRWLEERCYECGKPTTIFYARAAYRNALRCWDCHQKSIARSRALTGRLTEWRDPAMEE